ncbi:hypothetical protein CTAYLR_001629 [Chrysophaeum taylorii]|uniref:N-acetyltransferase domain-containing protein n=1 Tax=Chrysophaeum taylorii TaxID=2483200 RepID=A0AAD7XHV3_9STRA|nr:hypothetical protein CTAYLR_001629 [Chrysophaeum taylorii]
MGAAKMLIVLCAPVVAFVPSSPAVSSVRPRASVASADEAKVAVQPKPVLKAAPKVVPKPVVPAVTAPSPTDAPITYNEVRAALKAWTNGIIEIGKVYQEGGDYKAKAMEVIESNYAFSHDTAPGNQLLFKPTKAAEHPFRSQFDEFVSYFVGDGKYCEDAGFAITPWSKIRYDMYGVYIVGPTATVSGNYWFTNANDGSETKVEYSFQFVRVANPAGKLKIILHHSSIPFSPHAVAPTPARQPTPPHNVVGLRSSREAEAKQIIRDFIETCWFWQRAELRRRLRSRDDVVACVALVDDEVAGVAAATIDGAVAYIQCVVVTERWRHPAAGLGGCLASHLAGLAAKRGVGRLKYDRWLGFGRLSFTSPGWRPAGGVLLGGQEWALRP